MKPTLSCILALLLLLLPVHAFAAHKGYAETVQWWQDVRQKMVPYELQLQQIYAEVESSPGMLPGKVVQEFQKRLSREYPGSSYFVHGGVFKINNYTTLGFSKNWGVHRLTQQIGDLNKSYDFTQNTLSLKSGSNQLNFKLDLKSPENSRFTAAAIPAIAVTAAKVYESRPQAKKHLDGMTAVIEDVYRLGRLPASAGRMDQFAEQLLSDVALREDVLAQARQLYHEPSRELLARPQGGNLITESFLRTTDDAKSATGLLGGALLTIPWYVYAVFVGLIAAGGVTTTRRVKRYSRMLGLFEQLIRYSLRKREQPHANHYESRSTLNSPAEQKFQEVLEEILDTELYTLNGKARLADILKVRDGFDFGPEQAAFNRISRKHVDFVITEKGSSRIVGVVELDDRSHQRADRRNRDQQVDQWLKGAGIPVLHYPCRRDYSLLDVQRALSEVFGISPQPFGDFR
jgi:hypothetical protein